MDSHVSNDQVIENCLRSALEALQEVGELFAMPPMSDPEGCEAPRDHPGAFVWLTGVERTLLLGLQCETYADIGGLLGEEGPEAEAAGIDGFCEMLNIVAGVVKRNTADVDDDVVLGLPVLAPGPIAPKVVLANQAQRVQFGEHTIVLSLIMIDLSPEARKRKREEAENERLRQELQLSQKLEAIGQLAAGVAHEINTPLQYLGDTIGFLEEAFEDLNAMIGSLESIAGDFQKADGSQSLVDELSARKEEADVEFLTESVPTSVATARRGLQQVCTVVKALKAVGSAGQMQRTVVDVNELVSNTLTVTHSLFEGIAEVEQSLGETAEIHADPGQLSQVLIQLLTNAAEAMEEGREEVSDDSRGTVHVTTSQEGQEVLVSITDTGCGIPEEIRGKLFDPFFTTKEVGKNMGQGLSTVHGIIVEGHQGSIEVDSQVGEGTCFTLRLPVNTKAA